MDPDEVLSGVEWLGHAGFRIKTRSTVVYVDPWRAPGAPDAPGPAVRVALELQ